MQKIQEQQTVEVSSEYWPNQQKLRDQLSIPITISICPLQPYPNYNLCSFSSSSNLHQYRCHSCKAFINKYCTFKASQQQQSSTIYHTYDCSICGCTNRLPNNNNIAKDSAEVGTSTYFCITDNPVNKISGNKKYTYAFVLDLSIYGPEGCYTRRVVQYTLEIIRNFLVAKKQQQKSGQENNFNILIITFDKYLTQYYLTDNEICKLINTHLQQVKSTNIQEHLFKNSQIVHKILDDIVETINNKRIQYHSECFLQALEVVLAKTINYSGVIYFISGIRHCPGQFHTGLYQQPENWRQNFQVNKKKCLPAKLLSLCQKTQMSINFYIYNSEYINIMPLYVMTKLTNGSLRHYNPYRNIHTFYYQFQHALCVDTQNMGMQAILKVRSSSGLKLAGIFGQYRSYKGLNDQIQLVSCPASRRYIFQFIIQGKIQHPIVTVQFSILYTDIAGNRIFKIITHSNKVTQKPIKILQSLNYTAINLSYLHAILHNMDTKMRTRNLQIALQDRCKKHFQEIKKYNDEVLSQEGKEGEVGEQVNRKVNLVRNAAAYSMFTFLLIRHFIMNTKHSETVEFEKYVDLKSRMLTTDQHSIHAIWPAIYSISSKAYKIIEMKQQQIQQAQTAIVIDQGDNCHIYILDKDIRKQLFIELNRNTNTQQVINKVLRINQQRYAKYQIVIEVIELIKEEKGTHCVHLIVMDSVEGLAMLDEKGPMGYKSFIDTILQ